MDEAFWNGLFDARWEDAPLGPKAIWLVRKLRDWGYEERTRRAYGHAVVHLGRFLHAEKGDVQFLDESVVDDFVDRHLPVCCCYRRPVDTAVLPFFSSIRSLTSLDSVDATVTQDEMMRLPWMSVPDVESIVVLALGTKS